MSRRRLVRAGAAAVPLLAGQWSEALAGTSPPAAPAGGGAPGARVRPGDPAWPSPASWDRLRRAVGGRLVAVRSPLAGCVGAPSDPDCAGLFDRLRNPYYLGDEVGLTQTLGWVGAWTSRPSAYAVAVQTTDDVAAAVDFAREHRLRLVVKGGGHSYQGTSNAADSLLIWTRGMDAVTVHDAFVGAGCAGRQAPQPAVTVGAGALWGQVYAAVTTDAGRYVQGGGCLTVGVAGLVLSGGFGSFSKAYGTAAAGLLEAEVVTADGVVRLANGCTHPDLFWGLKGGGGGSLGVVTRLTLRTHPLPVPELFGAVFATVRATSDAAFRRLIGHTVCFYGEHLLNPHWGEQLVFRPDNALAIAMVFQGLDQAQAEAIWRPFFAWLADSPQDFSLVTAPAVLAAPARQFWDPALLRQVPGLALADDRPGAPESNVFWASNQGEAGQVLHGYQSAWLPAALLREDAQESLGDALFGATRHRAVALHTNKGLAGAPAEAVAAARDTATNPAALDAFALAISVAAGPPAYPGREPEVATARAEAAAVDRAMREVRRLLRRAAYVAESDFFEEDWRQAFWGPHYPRLLAVKDAYDPDGLFVGHHSVGSERWSADGFTRVG